MADLRSTVPARQLAVVASDEEEAVSRRAAELGFDNRRYDGRLTLLLPDRLTLHEFVARFDGVAISSVALQEVGLEHVYVDAQQVERLPDQ